MPPPNSSKKRRLSETGGDIAEAVLAATETPTADAEAPPRKKQSQRRSLFVRSLPASATTESLIAHFSESFPIKHASVVTDRETKQCKGFGFITFTDAEDAERALKEFNGSKFDGKKIKIEIAEPRKRDVEDAIPGAVAAGEGKPRSQPSAERVAAKVQREEDKKEATKAPKLIIRNLPWSIKKPEQLAKLFVKYGKVKLATLPQSKPGLLKGFGFVVLRGKPNAEKAMAEVNGMEVDGRTLAVDWAVEKEVWKEQNGDKEDVEMLQEEEELDDDTKISGVGVVSDEDDMDDEAGDDSDEDELDAEDESDVDMGDEDDLEADAPPPESTTLFVRNVPFDCDDDILKEHFTHFGPIRYARVVIDPNTERPRGTAFVCFFQRSRRSILSPKRSSRINRRSTIIHLTHNRSFSPTKPRTRRPRRPLHTTGPPPLPFPRRLTQRCRPPDNRRPGTARHPRQRQAPSLPPQRRYSLRVFTSALRPQRKRAGHAFSQRKTAPTDHPQQPLPPSQSHPPQCPQHTPLNNKQRSQSARSRSRRRLRQRRQRRQALQTLPRRARPWRRGNARG